MNSENKQKVLYIVTGIVLFIAIFFIAVQYENKYVVNYSEIFVDLTTAGIALTAVLVTIYTFNINRKHLQKQQFESTFFNMTKQLDDMINNLSFHNVKGREIFTYFYLRSRQVVDNTELVKIAKLFYPLKTFTDESQASKNDNLFICMLRGQEMLVSYEGVSSLIRMFGIFGFESSYSVTYLDSYFRFIYRILRFVDESTFIEDDPNYIDERYKYTSLLRAVLSPSELYFIYYDGLTNKGIEKFKPLIEKYSILKNFMADMTENSKFDKAMNLIIDNHEKDYYRYKSNIKKENQVKEFIPNYYYTAFTKDLTLFKNK